MQRSYDEFTVPKKVKGQKGRERIMLYPIIKVKDTDGHEHIVGENIHDTLYIDENGAIIT